MAAMEPNCLFIVDQVSPWIGSQADCILTVIQQRATSEAQHTEWQGLALERFDQFASGVLGRLLLAVGNVTGLWLNFSLQQ
jgi:hypothetical protein